MKPIDLTDCENLFDVVVAIHNRLDALENREIAPSASANKPSTPLPKCRADHDVMALMQPGWSYCPNCASILR